MRRFSVASLAAVVALIGGLLASPAAAFHIPGAAYSGPVSGGGSINFSVSGDGLSVTNLSLAGPIDGDTCTLISATYTRPIPITNNAFTNGEVSGNFSSVQHAQGTINITDSLGPGFFCHISQSWNAATSASPAGSAECQAALAQVNSTKSALKKAKKTGNQKKIKKLKKKLRTRQTTNTRSADNNDLDRLQVVLWLIFRLNGASGSRSSFQGSLSYAVEGAVPPGTVRFRHARFSSKAATSDRFSGDDPGLASSLLE